VGGVDLYVGGVEHAVLHLLYARFWHKVLYDLGHVSTAEPFRRFYSHGYILADAFTDDRGMYVPAAEVGAGDGPPAYQGRPVTRRAGKMGKSLKNSVSPDEIYDRYGADTLRLYEMAMGPLDTDRPWQTRDIAGVYRFLQRLWRTLIDEQNGLTRVSERPLDDDTLRRLHQTILSVRHDLGGLRFNTAVARLMELTTHAAKVAADAALPRALAEPQLLTADPDYALRTDGPGRPAPGHRPRQDRQHRDKIGAERRIELTVGVKPGNRDSEPLRRIVRR
jgi:leucyl-tRNA synthetase